MFSSNALQSIIVCFLICCAVSRGGDAPKSDRWAVIAAGSRGFMNYRHQADACHAYHVLLKSGIPEEQIILMMQDDVANSEENPFPGKLFNRMGDDVPDVYEGCKIDYSGKKVTAELFQAVITGNTSGADGKVLKSKKSDHVFLFFVDHGGTGIVSFPNGPFLHAKELQKSLQMMKAKHMFKELVFYVEACESGSMFPKLHSKEGIYVMTASNAQESSWGYYCMPKNDTVNGKHMGTCLGDLFSIAWMEDSDLGGLTETLLEQFERVKSRTTKSHVSRFGDMSFENETIGTFELSAPRVPLALVPETGENGAISVREIGLQTALHRWRSAETPQEKADAWEEYQKVQQGRAEDEATFGKILARSCVGAAPGCVQEMLDVRDELEDLDCHYDLAMAVHRHCPRRAGHDSGGWNGFNMKYSQTLGNLCERKQQLSKTTEELVGIVQTACHEASEAVMRARVQELEKTLRVGGLRSDGLAVTHLQQIMV